MEHTAGKTKSSSVPNKHNYSRISYLYQAAAYLAANAKSPAEIPKASLLHAPCETNTVDTVPAARFGESLAQTQGLHDTTTGGRLGSQRHLVSHLRAVSLKSQVRLSRDIKRTLCKKCDAILVLSSTCTSAVENASRLNKKPQADIQVVTCLSCGTKKRFPTGSIRQKSKAERLQAGKLPVVLKGAK